MRFSLRVYRWLTALYPASFRESYSGPLQRQFKDEYLEARTAPELLRLWLRTLADFARSMPVLLARELGQDARHALRLWRRQPWQTAFAIVVLAIAIGANTGVFSVLNALLIRTLPFERPDRLAILNMFGPPSESAAAFNGWRTESAYLSDATLHSSVEVNLDRGSETERARVTETAANFFDLLGTRPAIGRTFSAGEDTPGGGMIAVIGHALWRQRFGADPRAIGSTIRLNGVPLTIVGVAPPGFDYPDRTVLWTPTVFDFPRIPKTGVILRVVVGRLKDDVSWAAARSAFEAEADRRSPGRRNLDPPNRPSLVPVQHQLAGAFRQASFVLMGGVGILLLLACANIAGFMLARTLSRAQELTIRTALGASRARLTQQLLTETLLLAAIAAAAGLIVAVWTTKVAGAFQPEPLASQAYTILDWRVLSFAVAITVVTGLTFGIGPALYVARGGLGATRTSTASIGHRRIRTAIVGAQVALTVVLLTGSIALGQRFAGLLSVDNGYDVHGVATMNVSFAGTVYQDTNRAAAYYEEMTRRVRAVPGVVSVSATEYLPLAASAFMGNRFTLEGSTAPPRLATVVPVAPDYVQTMGARVLYGREVTAADVVNAELVAVVNEPLAVSLGDPQSIVGRLLTAPGFKPRRIVGVVAGMRDSGPAYPVPAQLFWPVRNPRSLTIVVRVAGPVRDRMAAIRDAVASVDPRIPVFDIKSMEERLDEVLSRPKFYTTTVVFFGGLALLLAIIGVYGVVAQAVVERLREMGIRLALGTTPNRLRRLLLLRTLGTIALGAAAGGLAAAGAGRYFRSLIWGTDAASSATSLMAIAALGIVAATTIWLATARVARLDIVDVLRPESIE